MTTSCICCDERNGCLCAGIMALIPDPIKSDQEIFIKLMLPSEELLCMKCWEKLYARLKEALPEEDPDFPKEKG